MRVDGYRFGVVVTAVLVLLIGAPLQACGPFFDVSIFTFLKHPDYPLGHYAHGELGVLQSSYARSYLVVAYRTLTGKPLSEAQSNQALAIWRSRMDSSYEPSEHTDTQTVWLAVRNSIPDLPNAQEVGVEKEINYATYQNCGDDAFTTAANTLNRLITIRGLASHEVKAWSQNQDLVFQYCSQAFSEPKPVTIPSTPEAQADLAYQLAAISFYGDQLSRALEQFKAISQDSISPWQATARYMMARTWVRQASLEAKTESEANAMLLQAQHQLQSILADTQDKALHPAAQTLLGLVQARLSPKDRILSLSKQLQQADDPNFQQDLIDYTVLLNQILKEDSYGPELPVYANLPSRFQEDDMTDWIATLQATGFGGFEHAYSRWEQTRSLPWLIAALTKAPSDMPLPLRQKLLLAAQQVPKTSPGYWSVTYHQNRLRLDAGERGMVHESLSKLLLDRPSTEVLPLSSLNLFQAQALPLAQNTDELIRLAVETPAGISWRDDEVDDSQPNPTSPSPSEAQTIQFSDPGAQAINRQLPLPMMLKASESKILPISLRLALLRAVWVRANLLNQPTIAREASLQLLPIDSQLKPMLLRYLSSNSSAQRQFIAIDAFLKNPGLRFDVDAGKPRSTAVGEIDNFQDNWWTPLGTFKKNSEAGTPPMPPLDLISPTEARQTLKEQQILAHLPPFTNYVVPRIIAWAKQHPTDPDVPEALSIAVKSPRYVYADPYTVNYSKQAFLWLHQHYPKSTWTNETPYWYAQ